MIRCKFTISALLCLTWVSTGCKTVGNQSALKEKGLGFDSTSSRNNQARIINTRKGFVIASNHKGFQLINCRLLDESKSRIQDKKLRFDLNSPKTDSDITYTLVPNLQRVYALNATAMNCQKVLPDGEASDTIIKVSYISESDEYPGTNDELKTLVSKNQGRFTLNYFSNSLYSFESEGINKELQYCSVLDGNFNRVAKDIPFNLRSQNFVSGIELMSGITSKDLEAILKEGTYVKCAPADFFSSNNNQNPLNRFLYFPLYIAKNKPHTAKEEEKELNQPQKIIEEYRKIQPGAFSCFASFIPHGRETGTCASIFNFSPNSESITLYLAPFQINPAEYEQADGTYLNGGNFLNLCADLANSKKSYLFKVPLKRLRLKSSNRESTLSNAHLFVNGVEKLQSKRIENKVITVPKNFVRVYPRNSNSGNRGVLQMDFKHKETTGELNSLYHYSVCRRQ